MSWKRFFYLASLFWSAFFSLAIMGLWLMFVAVPLPEGPPPISVAMSIMWMAPLCGIAIALVMTMGSYLFPYLEKKYDKNPQLELPF